MRIQWASFDLLTGGLLDYLPGIEPQWPLSRTISTATEGSVVLNLTDATVDDWERAILDGGSMLACFDDHAPGRPILWCGVVWNAPRTQDDFVNISLATFEDVLNRAYVTDDTIPITMARDDIIARLINTYFKPQTGITYLQLAYTAGNGAKPASPLVWQNTDNATVKDRLDQVIGQLGGEYTIEWAWGPNNQSLVPTLVFGNRIGTVATGRPLVTFEMPGQIVAFTQDHNYGAGAGANKIVAYSSSASGSTTPYAPAVYAPANGRPILEERYSPAPSIDVPTLTQYAQQALPIRQAGAQPITLTVAVDNTTNGRQLGVDWRLGDDVGYLIPSSYLDEQESLIKIRAFPNGASGTCRVIGYSFDPLTVQPQMADKTLYVQGGS